MRCKLVSDRYFMKRFWHFQALNRVGIRNSTDYSPFGVELDGRTVSLEGYRFGYQGSEKDNEFKGQGNSYTTEFRQLDPRLGRWLTCDSKEHLFPEMSSSCFASNTPLIGKDDNGLYTIFVNGYIYGKPNYTLVVNKYTGETYTFNDDIEPGKPYWFGNNRTDFTKEAHAYFGDYYEKFVNGTGSSMFSTASSRQQAGREEGKIMAIGLINEINTLNNDDNKENDVSELNFVTHSMGAAFAEGMIEEFMKHPELASLLKKGQVVHLSACDGDNILISKNSEKLMRTQLNFMYDKTLWWADEGARDTGGYFIEGVQKKGVVNETVKSLHPRVNEKTYDPHYDSKTWGETWSYMRALDSSHVKNTGTIKYLRKSDIE